MRYHQSIEGGSANTSDTRNGPAPALLQSVSCPPPSTPATRLPLADLIGNAEDAIRHAPVKEQSPEEQIGWIPNSSNSALTPGHRRKRAQSSSPLSSSQNEASTHFFNKEAVDMQKLQNSLRTPHADPAADLWSRYAPGTCAGADETPLGLKLSAFASLINDSSPHSLPRTPGGSVSGLRRWASCGIEWPASKAKRRRVHAASREQQDDVFVDDQERTSTDLPSKISRVGMLVEQMQATLAQPSQQAKRGGPSSSSPLPEKVSFVDGYAASPPKDRQPHDSGMLHIPQSRSFMDDQENGNAGIQPSQSTEYGSADIDLDGMDNDQDVTVAQPLEDQPLPLDPTTQNYTAAGYEPHRSRSHYTPLLDAVDEDMDEFGDDCDLTVEDLENAVSLFDTRSMLSQDQQPLSQGAGLPDKRNSSQPRTVKDVASTSVLNVQDIFDDVSDDDFGGSDLDDEQFAAAEVAATQAYQTGAATRNPVRHSNLPRL